MKTCVICGDDFQPRRTDKTCSVECSNALTRARHRESVRRQRERKKLAGQGTHEPWTPEARVRFEQMEGAAPRQRAWTPEGRARLAEMAEGNRTVRMGLVAAPDVKGRRIIADAWRRTAGLDGWTRIQRTAVMAKEPVAVVLSVLRSQGVTP